MDRSIFKVPFRQDRPTRYQCPSCKKALLRVVRDSMKFEESLHSKRAHSHDAWDPSWIEYRYSCLLECTTCKDQIASVGTGSVDEHYFYDDEGQTDVEYTEHFMPKMFVPHLIPFELPSKIPEDVAEEVHRSFSLMFADPPSAANHLRIALEHLLTHLRIRRFQQQNGKRSFLSLHRRIDLLPAKYGHVKELFVAVKWLGNAGSHSAHSINIDNVLDSYELMTELLNEIFDNRRKSAKALAKRINRRKGPT